MKDFVRCGAALFAFSLIALTTGPAPALIQPTWGGGGGGGGGLNLSGMYSGSVTDSVLGTGTMVANLAMSGSSSGGSGDPLGGWFNFTYGSTTYSEPTSADTSNGHGHGHGHGHGDWGGGGGGYDTIEGVFISNISSVACTFVYKATWSPSSYELSGEYQASSGCSGESGTFLITQQCYYQEYTNGSVRRNTGSGSGPGVCT